MFLGCSNTFGIGVNLEETWCWHVNQKVGGVMCNMGQGGGSAETCHRLAEYWIPIVKPKAVFMLTPPDARREFWVTNLEPVIFGVNRFDSKPAILPKHMVSEQELQLQGRRMRDAIEMMCIRNSIPFYYVYFHGMLMDEWGGKFPDFGRDGWHPGPDSHKKIAEKFHEVINDNV